MSIVRLKRQR